MRGELYYREAYNQLVDVENRVYTVLRDSDQEVFGIILRVTSPLVPMRTGNLRASARREYEEEGTEIRYIIRYRTIGDTPRRHTDGTSFNEPYAVYQERGFGYDGQPYQHYTTPGTGPYFLKKGLKRSVPYVRFALSSRIHAGANRTIIIMRG